MAEGVEGLGGVAGVEGVGGFGSTGKRNGDILAINAPPVPLPLLIPVLPPQIP